MKTASDLTSLSDDEFTRTVLSLVWNVERAMPAVFTSNDDRKQSFCVDFDGIDEKDEYQMASASWHWVSQYIDAGDTFTHSQLMTTVRCGEDLMIASYIVQKLGRPKLINEVCTVLIGDNKESWPKEYDTPTLFATKSAKQWFAYCQEYGAQVASGKKL